MRLIYAALALLLILMTSAQCQSTAQDWSNKGIALAAQGKYDDAIKAFDDVIRLNPNLAAEAWYNKALLSVAKASSTKPSRHLTKPSG
jgi:tetratricopeptide (TPR) repeat protein